MTDLKLPGSREPLKLMKAVDIKLVRDWVPASRRRRVDLTSAWARIKRHYCGALVTRGVCPGDCVLCRANIEDIFDMSDTVRDPLAIIVVRAKTISTRHIENLIARKKFDKVPTLETGELFPPLRRATENPFMEYQKEYESAAKVR